MRSCREVFLSLKCGSLMRDSLYFFYHLISFFIKIFTETNLAPSLKKIIISNRYYFLCWNERISPKNILISDGGPIANLCATIKFIFVTNFRSSRNNSAKSKWIFITNCNAPPVVPLISHQLPNTCPSHRFSTPETITASPNLHGPENDVLLHSTVELDGILIPFSKTQSTKRIFLPSYFRIVSFWIMARVKTTSFDLTWKAGAISLSEKAAGTDVDI